MSSEASEDDRVEAPSTAPRWLGQGLVLLVGGLVYLLGLSGPHVPKNGDEYPYAHITRLTAESGAFLPLRSDIPGMRDTKPPLLFFQGILSTGWGRRFDLLSLRWPSVLYTFLTALLAVSAARLASGRLETGLLAGSLYLAFWSTYRFGRPFLTNAPETFWLSLPMLLMVVCSEKRLRSRVVVPLLIGLSLGVAFLYKSFSLLAPEALALALLYRSRRQGSLGEFLKEDLPKVLLAGFVGIAVFSLWFLLDPDPARVFEEFVLKENLGKMTGGSYLLRALWGGSSLPALAVGFLLNGGPLAFLLLAMVVSIARARPSLSEAEISLALSFLAFFVAFGLPSQRSARYLLPAMPAVAVLLALRWHALPRSAAAASLVLVGLFAGGLGVLSLLVSRAAPGAPLYGPVFYSVLVLTALVAAFALKSPARSAVCVPLASLLAYASLALFTLPFDGPLGRYDALSLETVRGKDVLVPCDFVGKEEGQRLLLPGAKVSCYRDDGSLTSDKSPLDSRLVVSRALPGQAPCRGCLVLGRRLELKGRQSPEELREILRGRVLGTLVVEERLVEGGAEP